MSHPTEDDLILLYYREGDPAAVEAHLAGCAPCRQAFEALRSDLASITDAADPVPARGDDYGERLWRALRPRLATRSARRAPVVRWWAPAALAASLVAAFLLGRHYPAGPSPAPIAEHARDRIFLVMVGDHLERSEMVLLEVANAEGEGAVDVSAAQQSAASLVAANRLFRLNAPQAGEPGVASVLDELERVLIEVAHGPSQLGPAEREQLRRRLESGDILFKVRVLESKVRNKEKQMTPVPGTAS